MDLLTNPWVIITIVLCVIIGNIAVLKYTANMKMGQMKKRDPADQQTSSSQDDQPESKNPPKD
ncbi:DUF2897 family protein [Vibrio renipiscarius]|uniref:Uncharacterized protein n=1 Tax=Vibrio renipiscarius TaxID=1461322 RepID=A0A0C2JFT1_9VIBR|nr:DUF2897 family protein [Vibrio renipiscarius]KII76814.1 hypothetical protein PL18_16830 [Vibrio renipiscarius]KII76942.1 hypothetical protein OJ16_12530 [Vibrio renipiscarius]